MKALVTGANGFIGSHLVDRLVRGKNSVRCLVRPEADLSFLKETELFSSDFAPGNFNYQYGSLSDKSSLEDAVQGVDVVFHVAGAVHGTHGKLFRTNVDGTINVYRAAKEAGVNRFVFVSSLEAMGPSYGRILTEDARMNPITNYGKSKREAEAFIRAENTIPSTIIRPPVVYGPKDREVYKIFKMVKAGFGPKIDEGKQRVSIIHARDLVYGIMLSCLSETAQNQTYFISNDSSFLWPEIYAAMGTFMDKRVKTLPVPSKAFYAVSAAIEGMLWLFGKSSTANRDKATAGKHSWECSPEKAKKELGFSARYDLEGGIANTVRWYKENKWL
jgi:nucleoside-diphosphate-sugar epimerase